MQVMIIKRGVEEGNGVQDRGLNRIRQGFAEEFKELGRMQKQVGQDRVRNRIRQGSVKEFKELGRMSDANWARPCAESN